MYLSKFVGLGCLFGGEKWGKGKRKKEKDTKAGDGLDEGWGFHAEWGPGFDWIIYATSVMDELIGVEGAGMCWVFVGDLVSLFVLGFCMYV